MSFNVEEFQSLSKAYRKSIFWKIPINYETTIVEWKPKLQAAQELKMTSGLILEKYSWLPSWLEFIKDNHECLEKLTNNATLLSNQQPQPANPCAHCTRVQQTAAYRIVFEAQRICIRCCNIATNGFAGSCPKCNVIRYFVRSCCEETETGPSTTPRHLAPKHQVRATAASLPVTRVRRGHSYECDGMEDYYSTSNTRTEVTVQQAYVIKGTIEPVEDQRCNESHRSAQHSYDHDQAGQDCHYEQAAAADQADSPDLSSDGSGSFDDVCDYDDE